tara:strand:- start:573 stop:2792 length:2220 start_codon:yes stop_codon:yes gene_type:complete
MKFDHKNTKNTYILGISAFYHNSAACIILNGEIVAAVEEERFSRVKHDKGFPSRSINYCLEEANINQNDLNAVIYYDNPYLTFERLIHSQIAAGDAGLDIWSNTVPSWVEYKLHIPQVIRQNINFNGPILFGYHHRSHAASAFYASPFKNSAILTIDGVGEWSTASIGIGDGSNLTMLKEMRFPNSLGLLYSAFTYFTGFKVNSGEYKLMGLAPYGEPKYLDIIKKHIAEIKEDGSVELFMDKFSFLESSTMVNEKFSALFDGPARKPEKEITKREMDIARSIQVFTEEAVLKMSKFVKKLTGENNLCLAGGVALNCVANGKLLKEGIFDQIWIQPAAGDSGGALGCALDAYYNYFNGNRNDDLLSSSAQNGSYWGPEYSDDEIKSFLETYNYPHKKLDNNKRGSEIAKNLNNGQVIGHFSGRMEYGPRALGSRSIIGDARNREMQTTINLKIKYRESFRPFAPSVLCEKVSDYFDLEEESPYMLIVAPVKKERQIEMENIETDDLLEKVRVARSDIPAITHVDYSARVQTVNRDHHKEYYDVIKSFEKLTGYGIIVNTSFNVRGEPIVCTPYDAYRCFMRTEMDILVMNNFILFKNEQPDWPEEKGHYDEYTKNQINNTSQLVSSSYKNIFSNDFRLMFNKKININLEFQGHDSSWQNFKNEGLKNGVFAVDRVLDSNEPNPELMAQEIIKHWEDHNIAIQFENILIKLLSIRFNKTSSNEIVNPQQDGISESVYVMY